MQGIGTLAIDGPRFEEFLRSRKELFEVSQGGGSQGGLARILLLGCTAVLIIVIIHMLLTDEIVHRRTHVLFPVSRPVTPRPPLQCWRLCGQGDAGFCPFNFLCLRVGSTCQY